LILLSSCTCSACSESYRDGLFESWQESDNEADQELADRWLEIKHDAMDSGIKRITTWVTNFDNEEVMAARKALVEGIEGIDVYCNEDMLEKDDKGQCAELIVTANGGDKILSTSLSVCPQLFAFN
jgi:hypothetical protein